MAPLVEKHPKIRTLNVKRKISRGAIETPAFLTPDVGGPAYAESPDVPWELEEVPIIGKRVLSRAHFQRGTVVERFSGALTYEVMQHTLQVSPFTHILDTTMVGFLSHSCSPNCLLDMVRLEVLALKDIRPGEILSCDYAVTEDKLFKQFPCSCGSADCRKWISGRRERVNDDGLAYLAELRTRS